ncbi:MAG: LuxR C-terminal-related transcriptional regulator [Planctomycetota bacterium]
MTPREKLVLSLIGRGFSIPQIADRLFRSVKTIETHRQSLGRKLGVSNRVELARIAIQTGLAPLYVGSAASARRDDDPRALLADDPRAAEIVYRAETATAALVGVAYFRTLVEQCAYGLGVTGSMVLYIDEDTQQLHTVAAWHLEGLLDNFAIGADHVPCRETINQGFYACTETVEEPYASLTHTPVGTPRAVMGVRLETPGSGEPIGSLMLYRDHAGEDFEAAAEAVIRVCAGRAGAELDRLRLIDRLQRSVETLEQRLAERNDGD